MQNLYGRLIAHFKDELEVIQRLNEALERQQKALLDGDVAGLQESLGDVEALQREVADQESRRAELLSSAGVEGLGPETTLTEILERAPEDLGLEIHMVATQLVDLVSRMVSLNDTNFVLSANAHRFNQYLLKHLIGNRNKYGPDAQFKVDTRTVRLNAKV